MIVKRYIDKNFYIVRFMMNKGDEKVHDKKEIINNSNDERLILARRMGSLAMDTDKMITPRAITVIVSGTINNVRNGEKQNTFKRGDGAWPWTYKPGDESVFKFVAAEDDTEFHCIIPRDPRIVWLANIHKITKDQTINIEETDKYRQTLYVCSGSIKVVKGDKTIEVMSPIVVDMQPGSNVQIIGIDEDSLVVEMWRDGD